VKLSLAREGSLGFQSGSFERKVFGSPSTSPKNTSPTMRPLLHLGHVAGHDRKVGPDFAQAKRVPFDPFHLFAAMAAPSQG
jgi:hypothetical protein